MTHHEADRDYSTGARKIPMPHLDESADAAPGQLKDCGVKAQQLANNVAQQMREYGEKAQEAAKKFKPFTEKSMRDQPMATLAVASVIGFVLGALWKK
jgi:ElaB/YqjD/DUF883 family membrane-anchored ribosome-binding protein